MIDLSIFDITRHYLKDEVAAGRDETRYTPLKFLLATCADLSRESQGRAAFDMLGGFRFLWLHGNQASLE